MSNFKRGDLIFLSKPYVYVLNNNQRGKRCDYCFLKNDNLKRCSQCEFLYFCDRNCQKKSWDIHKNECKCIMKASPKQPSASMRLISQIFFKIKKYGYDEPYEEIHGRKVSFRTLMSHAAEIKQNGKACQQMVALIGTLKDYIGQCNIPPTEEFIEIFGKMCINTFSICDSEMQSIGSGIYLGASVFDHSCQPDAEVVFDGTNLSVRAVHDIPHSDISQIFISYIEQLQLTKDRQEQLSEQYYFDCQCSRCTSTYYDKLMTKLAKDAVNAKELLEKSNQELKRIKQMKKDNVSASQVYSACIQELVNQDKIFADTHICRIKILEVAFDACIENNQWADAITLGNQLTEPYKLYYGPYHPNLGIHFFKLGKIQNFQNLMSAAEHNLFQAEEVLKVTHGTKHPLYQDLLKIIMETQTCISVNKEEEI